MFLVATIKREQAGEIANDTSSTIVGPSQNCLKYSP